MDMLCFFRTIGYVIVFMLSACIQKVYAQSPVQLLPSTGSSHSTLLSDYYSGRQTGLSVLLRNTDAGQPFLQGYLRITIEGQGVKLQTGSYAIFPSIDLMEGTLVNLGPSDLAVYFKPQYLQGSIGFGINQPNVFPEGFYQFCFELLEKNTGRLIGSMQCVQTNLSYSEPVELNLPEDKKSIVLDDLANLTFQWKANHRNVSNSEYLFSLVAFESSEKVTESSFVKAVPVYTVKVQEQKLSYGSAWPPLQKGKKYAWRVQAFAVNEAGEKEPFRNDGYSEVYWFQLK